MYTYNQSGSDNTKKNPRTRSCSLELVILGLYSSDWLAESGSTVPEDYQSDDARR